MKVAVAVAAALLAGGCGGSGQSDREAAANIRATLRDYVAAFASGDGAGMCRASSGFSRRRLGDDAPSCAAGATARVGEIPAEIRGELRRARVLSVDVDGKAARADVRLTSRYASEPSTAKVDFVFEDGRWLLTDTPGDERPDTMTTCVIGGIRAFEDGQADAFWEEEGRADYVAFLRETCRRAVKEKVFVERQGALTGKQRRDLQRIYGDVVDAMVRSGRIRRP